MAGRHHLLIYEFGPGANFEGRLVGALERMEAAGELDVIDGLFVANDIDTGELAAIDMRSGSSGGTVARLLTFRLDAAARRRATAKTLSGSGSVQADVVRDLGGALKPGSATLALLTEGPEQADLKDAVERIGGRTLSAEPVESSSLAELAPELLAAVKDRSCPLCLLERATPTADEKECDLHGRIRAWLCDARAATANRAGRALAGSTDPRRNDARAGHAATRSRLRGGRRVGRSLSRGILERSPCSEFRSAV